MAVRFLVYPVWVLQPVAASIDIDEKGVSARPEEPVTPLLHEPNTEALLQLSGGHRQRLAAPSARDSVLLAQTNPWQLRE